MLPVSSVTAFTSIKSGQLGTVAFVVLASLLFVGLVVYGLWQSGHLGILLFLVVLELVLYFPMVMLNHVSEVYAYNAMPFFAMFVGISLGLCLNAPIDIGVSKSAWQC
jgi:hypothetical protein